MSFKEFNEDNAELRVLQKDYIEQSLFEQIHENTVIVCHDVLIRYKQGILLAKRGDEPAKGVLYVLGGRLLRGFPLEESARKKIKKECGLDIENIEYLITHRTMYAGDPFLHGHGTDTLNLVFIADGVGDLALNDTLLEPTVITQDSYKMIREELSPYNRTLLDIVNERNLW